MEKIKKSVIVYNTRFTALYVPTKLLFRIRSNNLTTTQMVWVTLRPHIDLLGNLDNGEACIFLFLN